MEKSFQVRPVGVADFGIHAVCVVLVTCFTFYYFRREPSAAIGAASGLLIVQLLGLAMYWNPRVLFWWEVDKDGISHWSKPFTNREARRKHFVAWKDITAVNLDSLSLGLVRRAVITAKDGTKLCIPRQTDRFFELIDILKEIKSGIRGPENQ